MMENDRLDVKSPAMQLRQLLSNASNRKVRLLTCACLRLVWSQLNDLRSRQAVELAEQLADEMLADEELRRCSDAAYQAAYGNRNWAVWAAVGVIGMKPDAVRAIHCLPKKIRRSIVQDVFPGLEVSTLTNPAWLTSTAVAIAQGIYDDRAFDRLPFLADALQDAGCENAEILAHCRGEGPHVRGCWVVDLVLGKT